MRSRPDPLFEQQFRQQGSLVAGVDEVGVGAWAGPVVAAAVILPRDFSLAGLNDSKLLTARRRAALFGSIRECAVAVGVGLPTLCQATHVASGAAAGSGERRGWVGSKRLSLLSMATRIRRSRSATLRRARAYE